MRVSRPGLLTTVQDGGRWGFQSWGVPVAGPMDMCSHRLANAIVGNAPSAATLEVTLTGPVLEFDDTRTIAVTGAEFEEVPAAQAFEASVGRPLRFGTRIRGARAYVAISGGIDVPAVLGSRATHLPTGMGGIQGRGLKEGDVLSLGLPGREASGRDFRPTPVRFDTPTTLRVLAGPQADRFADGAIDALQSATYRIDSNSNRIGYRLQGPHLRHLASAEIISDATPMGAIQVPASGEPILLMADRQTTGGYAKIATVISADICAAGQLAPGDEIRFVVCSMDEAIKALRMQEEMLLAAERT